MSSIAGTLFRQFARQITLSGNIGKCPECNKIQFVDEVPELREMQAGTYENLEWACPKCKSVMQREESIVIPKSKHNGSRAGERLAVAPVESGDASSVEYDDEYDEEPYEPDGSAEYDDELGDSNDSGSDNGDD